MMKRLIYTIGMILVASGVMGQTSRFDGYFRDSSGPLLDATIYVVSDTDSLLLTQVDKINKPGLYRRADMPWGIYRYWVNGVKTHEDIVFGVPYADKLYNVKVTAASPSDDDILVWDAAADSLKYEAKEFYASSHIIYPTTVTDKIKSGATGSALGQFHGVQSSAGGNVDILYMENSGTGLATATSLVAKSGGFEGRLKYKIVNAAPASEDAVWLVRAYTDGTEADMWSLGSYGSGYAAIRAKTNLALIQDAGGNSRITIENGGALNLIDDVSINSLQYTAGSPSADYILRTDVSGNATWVDPSTVLDLATLGDMSDYTETGVARGDLIRRGASGWENLALGASGKVLKSDGTDIVWGTDAGGSGANYADSLRFTAVTGDSTIDFDGYVNTVGEIDTTNIDDGQFTAYIGNHSASSTLLNLTDTPASYSGQANKILKVNSGQTAVVFGANLTNLEDVSVYSASDKDIMGYDGTGGEWSDRTRAELELLTYSTSFGGDVSGTYNAIVVGDNSHKHTSATIDTAGSDGLATTYDIDSLGTDLRDDMETDQLSIAIVNPDSVVSTKICIFKNYKGSTITIDSMKLSTDNRNANYVVEVHESVQNDTTSQNLVDQIVASQSGTGCYYKTETTISHAAIENTHWLWLKLWKTIDVADMQLTVFYHY